MGEKTHEKLIPKSKLCKVQRLIFTKKNSIAATQVLFPHIYNRPAIIVY